MIKRGFSLLELVLVLGVGTVMAFIKFQDLRNEQEKYLASATGEQMKQMGEAVNRYISVRYDKLSTLSSSMSQTSDPGPRYCTESGCEITYKTLINEGLLPPSFSGVNAQKSTYKIYLKRTGITPNYVINGLITTITPWVEGGKIRYDLLGKAMQSAGIDSGMTQSTTLASGYKGSWQETSTDYTSINKVGLLAYRVGYNSSMYSVYLRRDGTLPMTGNLDMGNNSIKNARNGQIWEIESGYIKNTGDISTRELYVTQHANIKWLTAEGYSIFKSSIEVQGSNHIIVKDGSIQSGSLRSFKDMTVGGDLFLQNRLKLLGMEGVVTLGNNAQIQTPDWYTVKISGDKTIQSTGNLQSEKNIVAKGNVSGTYLQTTSTVVENTSCLSNGLISKDIRGNMMTCINKVWKSPTPLAASGIFVTNSNKYYPCSFPNRATGTCSCSPGLTDLIINTTSSTQCSGGQNDHCTTSYTYFHACS
ncbi:shufflon system plasmid conjugative transfer pilus tip adhesin PilV [Klebsiella pneumoniae]